MLAAHTCLKAKTRSLSKSRMLFGVMKTEYEARAGKVLSLWISYSPTYLRIVKHLRRRTFLLRIPLFFVNITLLHRALTSRAIVLNASLTLSNIFALKRLNIYPLYILSALNRFHHIYSDPNIDPDNYRIQRNKELYEERIQQGGTDESAYDENEREGDLGPNEFPHFYYTPNENGYDRYETERKLWQKLCRGETKPIVSVLSVFLYIVISNFSIMVLFPLF